MKLMSDPDTRSWEFLNSGYRGRDMIRASALGMMDLNDLRTEAGSPLGKLLAVVQAGENKN